MDIGVTFAKIQGALPVTVTFEGTHFRYAEKNGVTLIESRRWDPARSRSVFCYWLISDGKHRLVHTAEKSKLRPTQSIGASFSPRDHGE